MPLALIRDLELDFLLLVDLVFAIGPGITWGLLLSTVLVLCAILVVPLVLVAVVGLWIYGRLREPPVTLQF